MSRLTRVSGLFSLAIAGFVLVSATAQTRKETAPSAAAKTPPSAEKQLVPAGSAPHELTGTDLEAFLDGEMPSQLNREDIAGAVIAVVKDGKVIFAKGYGFSDVEKRAPVTADATSRAFS